MPISASDISYVYSGGATNTDPDESLGGDASVHVIVGNVIFDSVTPNEAAAGSIDYRCVYISNDNASDNFYNAEILIQSQVAGGATVMLGFDEVNDRQSTTITNFSTVTGGSVTMEYVDTSSHSFTFAWNASVTTMASNYQTQIRTIDYLGDVTVTGSYDAGTNTATFEVNFVGDAANRYHQGMTVTTNSLTYSGSAPTVANTKVIDGGPINSTAELIDVETTPPTNVTFSSSGFTVGTFRSMDIIPVWVKRTVASGSTAIENDGFVLRLTGNLFPT